MFKYFSSHKASRLLSVKIAVVVLASVALVGVAVNTNGGESSPTLLAGNDEDNEDEEGETMIDELEPPLLTEQEIDDVLQRASLAAPEITYAKKENHVATSRSIPMGITRAKLNTEYGLNIENITITDEELYLLAKIIECEARFEPYLGKVAVGVVVMNRVKSKRFPNNIGSVIFQKGQFQPLVDGGWENKEPGEDSYRAALEALAGVNIKGNNDAYLEGDALFFIYHRLASESGKNWFTNSLRYITTIGNHDFYSY